MFASYEVATSFPSLTAIKGYDLDKSTYVPLMGHIVGGWFWWFLVGGVHNGQSSKYSVLILFLGAPTCRADRTPTHGALDLALTDTFQIFIFSLNRAKKWFNAMFNSKLNPEYSLKKIIHLIGSKLFIKKMKNILNNSKGWGQSAKLGTHSAICSKLGTALQAYALNPCTKFPPNPTSRKVNT